MSETAARHARITGLDVARAFALLGMFAAHVANAGEYGPGGWRWLIVSHGRASALFAVLAGVSISLMLSHAQERSSGEAVRRTRVRVAVRGAMLLVLGWLLATLSTPVDVILDNLGVMFLIACLALRWRARTLIGVGGVVLIAGRAALAPLVEHMPRWLYEAPVLHELWGRHYPALIWVGYVLVGMGVARLRPWRGERLAMLGSVGVALAVMAYGTAAMVLVARHENVLWADPGPVTHGWFEVYAHSYSPWEMAGNVGVALFAIAVCCWLAERWPRVVWPLAATGSMTLTLYSAQVVVIAFAGPDIVFRPSNAAWLAMCAASIACASLWRWRAGQGPLENVFTTASTAAADADARVRRAA